MVIWFDITNVPQVNFMLPFIRRFGDSETIYSLRDFAETKDLFIKRVGAPFIEVGDHKGNNKIRKVLGLWQRRKSLMELMPDFDVKLSCGGATSSYVARKKHRLSISFDDNDRSANWLYAPYTDLAFFPNCIPVRTLRKQLFSKNNLYQYNGYKEDIYLADYVPDPSFIDTLPFDEYVVVRPENLKAGYVSGTMSVVPDLLQKLCEARRNVLFLPRYASDRDYAKGFDNVFVPDSAVNGLDACYYAQAVLTGAGTMAREAACLGVPAVSFYAGKELLTVDQSLIAQRKMCFSRDVAEIMQFVIHSDRQSADLNRCKAVQEEVFDRLDFFLNEQLN